MKNEIKALKNLGEELEDRPYTGLISVLPPKYQVATNKNMIYFKLKYYYFGLDAVGQESFSKYVTSSIAQKLDLATLNKLEDGTSDCTHWIIDYCRIDPVLMSEKWRDILQQVKC